MPKAVIQPKQLWDSQPRRFSQGIRVGNTIYVAGQLGLDREGKLPGEGDVVAQGRQVFENIKAVLAEAGAGLEHVVKLNLYFTNMADLPKLLAVREEYLKAGGYPASTAVQVGALAVPGALLEVEAVAVVE